MKDNKTIEKIYEFFKVAAPFVFYLFVGTVLVVANNIRLGTNTFRKTFLSLVFGYSGGVLTYFACDWIDLEKGKPFLVTFAVVVGDKTITYIYDNFDSIIKRTIELIFTKKGEQKNDNSGNPV